MMYDVRVKQFLQNGLFCSELMRRLHCVNLLLSAANVQQLYNRLNAYNIWPCQTSVNLVQQTVMYNKAATNRTNGVCALLSV